MKLFKKQADMGLGEIMIKQVSLKIPRALMKRNIPNLDMAISTILQLVKRDMRVQLGQHECPITAETHDLQENKADNWGNIPTDPHYRDVVMAMLAAVKMVQGSFDNLVSVAEQSGDHLYMPDLISGRKGFHYSEIPEWMFLDRNVSGEVGDLSPQALLRIAWFINDRAYKLPANSIVADPAQIDINDAVRLGRVTVQPAVAAEIPSVRVMGLNLRNNLQISSFGSFWGPDIYREGKGGLCGSFEPNGRFSVTAMRLVRSRQIVRLEATMINAPEVSHP